MIGPTLATEDALSEALGKRLLAEHQLFPELVLRRNGAGYLRARMDSWCEMARRQPVIVLTDLDQKACAPLLLSEWLANRSPPKGLVLRVAVREVESWLLADHAGMCSLLGRSCKNRLPLDPDSLPDPKRFLLTLAERAPTEVRRDLLPAKGATSLQGLGYNARLCAFVASDWNPSLAQARSPSLRRANSRVRELAETLAEQ